MYRLYKHINIYIQWTQTLNISIGKPAASVIYLCWATSSSNKHAYLLFERIPFQSKVNPEKKYDIYLILEKHIYCTKLRTVKNKIFIPFREKHV